MSQSATAPDARPDGEIVLAIKHLEFIENVIARMGSNSFAVKNWAVAVTSGLLAFSTKDGLLASLLGGVVVVVFWGIDAYDLMTERRFRVLYNEVRKGSAVEPFDMNCDQYRSKESWRRAAFSKTSVLFYGSLATVAVAVVIGSRGLLGGA